ncbi:MAG: hypothetical protein K0S53_1084 [Bacteroidetes bacterium]|jgi:predicted GH43/DUF377 family glycosyl hydrolase|nr:hypothetical protein [Bacteroidota bacterium]
MNWQKIKQVFVPDKNFDWMFSHAANPVPYVLDAQREIVRVFFTSRTESNISHIGYVDIDFLNDYKVLHISDKPVLAPGTLGLFDDSGTAMGCLVEKDHELYLFYLGWNLKVTVPWLNTIGLAKADSVEGEFKKTSLAPVMDRSHEDPFSISYPSVLFDGGKYKMWYGSNLSWGKDQSEMQHVIKYAESVDLVNWKRTNEIHVSLIHKNEYALSKPWVVKTDEGYTMWYSYRANGDIKTYRIGFAQSADGKNWKRFDENAGITVSASGWDSEMICYPSVFKLNNKQYMLYNGNGYGKTGFGVATLI